MKKANRRFSLPRFRGIKVKAAKWIRRFLPAEVAGTLMAIASSYAALHLGCNRVTTAYITSITETISFYITILATDALLVSKQLQAEHQTLTLKGLLLIFRNMVLDFGLAEVADSLLIRPLFLYIFPLWFGNYTLGIVAGKVASDLAFYVPVIIAGEIRIHMALKQDQHLIEGDGDTERNSALRN
jgi:hypothetical protein